MTTIQGGAGPLYEITAQNRPPFANNAKDGAPERQKAAELRKKREARRYSLLLVDGWNVFQAVGANEKACKEKRIVADVNEIGGEDGARARSREGENNADYH